MKTAMMAGWVLFFASTIIAAPYIPSATNVRSWGAIGDGVEDDTVAIQNTSDFASNAGGGLIYAPAGHYITTHQIALGSNVRFAGDGSSTKIENITTNDYIITAFNKTNVVIENLCIIGHGVFSESSAGRAAIKLGINPSTKGSTAVLRNLWIYDSGVCGLNVDGWSDVCIQTVFISNAAEHGMYLTDANNVKINELLVVSNRFGVGIKIVNSTNVVVKGTFRGTENAGGLFEGAVRCAFESCIFENNAQQGVRINAPSRDCEIRNCTINLALQDEIRDTGGINTKMTGNRIYARNRGIVCDSAAILPLVFGNFFQITDGPAILVNSKAIIKNNVVTGVGLPVEIGSLSTNTVMSSNSLLTGMGISDFGVGTAFSE